MTQSSLCFSLYSTFPAAATSLMQCTWNGIKFSFGFNFVQHTAMAVWANFVLSIVAACRPTLNGEAELASA